LIVNNTKNEIEDFYDKDNLIFKHSFVILVISSEL